MKSARCTQAAGAARTDLFSYGHWFLIQTLFIWSTAIRLIALLCLYLNGPFLVILVVMSQQPGSALRYTHKA